MKCLVTGSEGFIGRNLVEALVKEGHSVIGCDSKIGLDLRDVVLPNDVEVVYHLACVNQMRAVSNPALNLNINAFQAKRMADYAAEIGAKFVYTSTASVYGNAEEIPTPVTAKLNPITDYAVAKLAGEYFVQNSGADWTILRLSNVYGPYQTLDNPYCGVVGRFISQALTGVPLTIIGDGMQTRDFSYVDDVVGYLKGFTDSPMTDYLSERILNVSSGEETSVSRVAKTICVQTGGFFRTGEDKRPIDGINRRLLVPDLVCTTPLSRGILKTVQWFQVNKV